MKEVTEEAINRAMAQSGNARLVALNQSVLVPLLDAKIENGIAILCQNFKAKGQISMEQLALVSVCRDLKEDFKAIARTGEKANQVINMFPTDKKQGE